MRLRSTLPSPQLYQSDTTRQHPTRVGMEGLRHKLRHKKPAHRFQARGGPSCPARRECALEVWSPKPSGATVEFFDFGAGSNFCADPKPPRFGVTGNSLANMAGVCHPNAPGPQNVVGVIEILLQLSLKPPPQA